MRRLFEELKQHYKATLKQTWTFFPHQKRCFAVQSDCFTARPLVFLCNICTIRSSVNVV